MRIDPSDLSTFLAIARHRSFRAAATELGVSASALSHALRSIESRLDLRLINRTTRSVALTEAGQLLFERISPAFRDLDDALEDLNNFRGKPVGTLRFNAARQSAQLVLLPIVTRFLKAFPDIKVEIVINDALVDMVSAGFDAGVRFGETIAADMIAVPIGPRHRFAVVGSSGYFKHRKTPTSPHDLKAMPCIRYRFVSGALYRWEFERGGIELNIDVEGSLTLSDQDLMVDAALDGAGLAYVFEAQVADLIARKKLVRVLADWCPAYPGFFLYYPSRRQLPAALRAFVDFAKAAPQQAIFR
jgi:DNA-binding transcriptional LysR family regulator